MKRKTFIRITSGLASAPLMSPLASWAQDGGLTNWSGNVRYSTSHVFYPRSTGEVIGLVKEKKALRALGTRHCFNRIADSRFNLVSSNAMNHVVLLDPKAQMVIVEGGIKYGELCPFLDAKGLALHNLASLPHISVAGSISTGTHGSGVHNGNLATAVSALQFVRADGQVDNLSWEKDRETMQGSVVSLGALGWISQVTLNLQPRYDMRQYVFEQLPLTQLNKNFEEILSSGYSVSLFTDWASDSVNEVWIKLKTSEKNVLADAKDFYGATAATRNMHPIASLSAVNCTEQMGVPGPWYERLPHFKMGFTPSSGKELQTEYFIPHAHALEAFGAIQRLGKKISPHLFISEIRTIARDDLWLSPCHHRDSVTIHFTWKPEWESVRQLLPVIERELAPYQPRPHWGKLFTMEPRILASRYEKMEEFRQLVHRNDPRGKFQNDFIKKYVLLKS